MSQLLNFTQSYSPFESGKSYLLEDQIASTLYNLGVATIVSDPVTIENASLVLDSSKTDNILSGGTQTTQIVDKLGVNLRTGIPIHIADAVLSDTVNLVNSGWIQPRLLGGNIKYTTVGGEVRADVFDQKETSLILIKRVWLNGTTPNMGIVVYYE